MSETKKKVLKREPFRWTLDGEVCRWCYEMLSLEEVLEIHGLELIEKLDSDTAIVTGELK